MDMKDGDKVAQRSSLIRYELFEDGRDYRDAPENNRFIMLIIHKHTYMIS